MTNISKDKLKNLFKAILDNTLLMAANNLTFEAAIAFNSTQSIPESEYDKEKKLEDFTNIINGQMRQAKEQSMIYIDELVLNEEYNVTVNNEEELIENYVQKIHRDSGLLSEHLMIRLLGKSYYEVKVATEKVLIEAIDNFEHDYPEGRYLTEKYKALLHKSQTEF